MSYFYECTEAITAIDDAYFKNLAVAVSHAIGGAFGGDAGLKELNKWLSAK